MIIKKIAVTSLIAASLSIPAVQADTDELIPALYIEVPFSAEARNMFDTPSLGLAMKHGTKPDSEDVSMRTDIPAFFDMSFKEGQLDTFSFNGVNALEKSMRMNADGAVTTTSSINWGLVAIGTVAGALVVEAFDEDKEEEEPAPLCPGFTANDITVSRISCPTFR